MKVASDWEMGGMDRPGLVSSKMCETLDKALNLNDPFFSSTKIRGLTQNSRISSLTKM